jgi:uncharacterized protein YihD (DUF1040 family)
MRDPARINEVLETLRAAWQLDPDLRLGQLIVNAVRPSSPCPEVFYVEDDKLAEGLARYVKARRSAQSKP